jgi:dienelactone hydrolase
MIEYAVGERITRGYLALPAGGAGPGVLVLHAWWGLNDFFKGFCDLATAYASKDIGAVVVFYGNEAGIEEDDFARSQAAFLGHFAETDEWEPAVDVQQTEQRLRAAGRPVTFHFYPNVGHWFAEADRPDAFDAEAAELAWQRTVDFLQARLNHPA